MSDLDGFARGYYLDPPDDIDIEERQQAMAMPLILDLLHGRRRVLEMGYGTGLVTAALADAGLSADLLEGSTVLCQAALARHPTLTIHQGRFETFTATVPYDAVLALHVLEHVESPQDVLWQARTWLKPGGSIIVAVPNAQSLHRRLAVAMGLQPALDTLSERDRLVGHRRVYTLDSLTDELADAGLRVDEQFGWFLKPLSNGQMRDWDAALLAALHTVSADMPRRLLANVGVRAVRP